MSAGAGGSAVLELASCGSTNTEAMRLALAGESGPMWVRADRQEGGRGRAGRSWVSLPGNLHASLMVRFPGPLDQAPQLSLVAGAGVADAICAASVARVGRSCVNGLWLKWPNDIMVGPEKCGGILVETSVVGRGGEVVAVIGVGLNLAHRLEDQDFATTCLWDHGLSVAPGEMLEYLDRAMLLWLARWDRGAGFGDIRSAWLERSGELGEPVSVHDGQDVLKGRFGGLSEEGHLVLELDGGGVRHVAWGDVSFP